MRRILYLSVHESLEHDDLRLLGDAGLDVFSPGSYADPDSPGNRLRGRLPRGASQEDFQAAEAGGIQAVDGTWRITRDFARRFDALLVNHDPKIVIENFEVFMGKPIVFRTVGQSYPALEEALTPLAPWLTVVRCSTREAAEGILPTARVIRFGKYVDEYPTWRPGGGRLLTFMHDVRRTSARPLHAEYDAIVSGHDADLYGLANEGLPNARGLAPEDRQRALYAQCRAYIYIHSLIAPYTLNVLEALCAGAPILAPSAAMTSRPEHALWRAERYEVEALLSGGAGLIYGSVEEARNLLARLDDLDLPAVSGRARALAHDLFDARRIAEEWRHLFAEL